MRRLALLAGLALLATVAPAPAATAHAGTVCRYVNERMTTSKPLFYSFIVVQTNVGFSISGPCPVTGVFDSASCDNSVGSGTLLDPQPHHVAVQWVGNQLIFTGQAQGVLLVHPDVANGESCVSGADVFIVNGTIVTT